MSQIPSSTVVRATFDWRANEYGQVVQRMTRERFTSGGWLLGLLALCGWVLWQVSGIVRALVQNPTDPRIVIAAAPWVILLALWAWLMTHGFGWFAARQAQRIDPTRVGTLTHAVDAMGLSVDTGSGKMELPWSGMLRITETHNHFLWYWNQSFLHYTPKRAMSPESIGTVRRLIRTNAPEKAQLAAEGDTPTA